MNTLKNKLAVITILLLIALTAITSYLIVRRYDDNNKWVKHTHEVIEALQEMEVNFNAAEFEAREYIISANMPHHERYRHRTKKVYELIDDINRLTKDNAVQQANAIRLLNRVNDRIADLDYKVAYRRTKRLDTLLISSTMSGSDYMRRAEDAILNMKLEEVRLLALRSERVARSRRLCHIINYA